MGMPHAAYAIDEDEDMCIDVYFLITPAFCMQNEAGQRAVPEDQASREGETCRPELTVDIVEDPKPVSLHHIRRMNPNRFTREKNPVIIEQDRFVELVLVQLCVTAPGNAILFGKRKTGASQRKVHNAFDRMNVRSVSTSTMGSATV
jgi:hypothetical protein